MNLWVLFLCRFFTASKVKKSKVTMAALFSALGEVLILCVPFGSGVVKMMAGFGGINALVIYWLFRPESRMYFGKLLIYSYLAMFVLGGILILIETILGSKKVSMLSWGIVVVFLVALIEKIYIKIKVENDFVEVLLTISENQQCRLTALVDSGNGLREPISKIPVSIVEEAILNQYRKWFREENFRVVPFHSIGEEHGMLEAYFIEKIEIKKEGESIIVQNPMIAITKERISANGNYQMILHPNILKQGGRNSDF